MMGASCDTPWVCLSQSGMARAKMCRWGMQGFFDGNGGMRVAWAWRLCLTCLTCLTSWCARLRPDGLRRGKPCDTPGVAVSPFGLAQGGRCAARVKPAKKSGGEAQRASRRAHGQVCEGFLRDPSLKRSGNAPDRYPAFFAKLFFTRKKSGQRTRPLPGFFCKAFFSTEKKRYLSFFMSATDWLLITRPSSRSLLSFLSRSRKSWKRSLVPQIPNQKVVTIPMIPTTRKLLMKK